MDGWEWDSDPTAYVLSANVHRRHLSSSQKAMAYAMMYPDGRQGQRTDLLKNINKSDVLVNFREQWGSRRYSRRWQSKLCWNVLVNKI